MRRHRESKLHRWIRFIIFLSVLITPMYVLFRPVRTTAKIISPIPDGNDAVTIDSPAQKQTTRKPLLNFLSKTKKPDNLKTPLKKLADEKWNNYSILVMDLNSDFVMGLNETAIYDAASVNKIPILATLYHEASRGNIDFSKTITLQEKDRQDYGTGSIRYDPAGSVYSIKTLANLMIKKSDNTAAYILANYILSLKEIQTYVERLGLLQTNMIDNTTSNKDMGILITKIFEGTVANPALTTEMIGLLKDTDFEDRLPAQLPDDVTVYHKIGTGVGAVHDVGVIESNNLKYYVGIFTGDIHDEEQAAEQVAEVSRAIYEFMK